MSLPKLSLPLRRIIYICFIAAFFIAAPLLLLYGMGYRYNFLKEKIERTGVLILSFTPEHAVVKLNGTTPDMQRNNNVVHINDLYPGRYITELTAKGYRPLTRIMNILPNQSSVYKHLTLFPSNPQPTLLHKGTYLGFTTDTPTPILAASSASTTILTLLNNYLAEQQQLILPTDSYAMPNIYFSGDQRWAVIQQKDQESFLVDRQEGVARFLAATSTTNFTWLPGMPPELYALTSKHAVRLHIQTGTTTALGSSLPLQTLTQYHRTLFGITAPINKTDPTYLVRWDAQKQEWEHLFELPGSPSYHFTDGTAHLLALHDTRHALLYLIDPQQEAHAMVVHIAPRTDFISWNFDGTQLLTGNAFELSLLSLENEHHALSQERVLLRVSRPITRAQWHQNFTHILYQQDDAIHISSLEDQPSPDTISYIQFEDLIFFTAHPTKQSLLALGTFQEQDGLFEIPLVVKE